MIEHLQKYSALLSFTNIQDIKPSLVSKLLSLAGMSVDEEVIDFVLTGAKSVATEKGYTKFSEMVIDPTIVELFTQVVEAQSAKVSDAKQLAVVSVEAVIRCPHCSLPFALQSAVN